MLLRVSDVMKRGDEMAVVPDTVTVHDALYAVTRAGAGLACVVDAAGRLTGVFSDGDARRFFVRVGPSAWDSPVAEAMTRTPRSIDADPLAAEALANFEGGPVKFGDLPVLDADGRPIGVLTLKDLIRAGIVPRD